MNEHGFPILAVPAWLDAISPDFGTPLWYLLFFLSPFIIAAPLLVLQLLKS